MAGSTEATLSVGTAVAISVGTPATPTPTAYAVLGFTEVAEVINVGAIGRTYPSFSYALLSGGMVTQRGNADDGTTTIQMAYAPGDTGQQIIETALGNGAYYSFRATLPNGAIKYFQARVMGSPTNIGDANTVIGSTASLAIKAGSTITALPDAPYPTPPLTVLTLSAAAFPLTEPQGTPFGTVLGKSDGSTLSLLDDGGGAVTLIGVDLLVGPTAPTVPTSFNITIRESLTGATNTPRDTTFTIVVTGPVAPDDYVLIVDTDGATLTDTDDAFIMEPV